MYFSNKSYLILSYLLENHLFGLRCVERQKNIRDFSLNWRKLIIFVFFPPIIWIIYTKEIPLTIPFKPWQKNYEWNNIPAYNGNTCTPPVLLQPVLPVHHASQELYCVHSSTYPRNTVHSSTCIMNIKAIDVNFSSHINFSSGLNFLRV